MRLVHLGEASLAQFFFGLATTMLLTITVGCGHPNQASTARGEELAQQFEAITPPQGTAMIDADLQAIYREVLRSVQAGRAGPVAAIILNADAWRDARWYLPMAEAFARAYCGERAVVSRDAPDCLEALQRLAEDGPGRETRVHAARAIRFEKPDVAKKVLLELYGTFRVEAGNGPDWRSPPPTASGHWLMEVGCTVPNEVQTTQEVADVLRLMKVDLQNCSSDVLARVANAYNRRLRQWVDEKNWTRLAYMTGEDYPKWEMLVDLYHQVLTAPPSPPMAPLFGDPEKDGQFR